jgi:hypothetical protein
MFDSSCRPCNPALLRTEAPVLPVLLVELLLPVCEMLDPVLELVVLVRLLWADAVSATAKQAAKPSRHHQG